VWPNTKKRQLFRAAALYQRELGIKIAEEDILGWDSSSARTTLNFYKSTEMPALLAFSILQNYNEDEWLNVKRLGERLTYQQKAKLKQLDKSKKFKTQKQRVVLFDQLGKRHEKLEKLVDDVCALDESRISVLADIYRHENAFEYCISAPDSEITILKKIDDSYKRESAFTHIKDLPENLLPFAEYAIQALKTGSDICTFFDDRTQETLEIIASLIPKNDSTNQKLDSFMDSIGCTDMTSTNAGVMLRAFRGLPSNECLSLMDDLGEKCMCDFSSSMEPHLKEFAHNYWQLTDQKRQSLIEEIGLLRKKERYWAMSLTNRYGYDSHKYRAGIEMDSLQFSDHDIKSSILDSDILLERIFQIPEESRRTYMFFTGWIGAESMECMSLTDFRIAEKAHYIAKNKDEEVEFSMGMRAVARDNGDIGNWARSIMNHYQNGLVGGDNYKKRGVIAA
jgi:hypothetical protein